MITHLHASALVRICCSWLTPSSEDIEYGRVKADSRPRSPRSSRLPRLLKEVGKTSLPEIILNIKFTDGIEVVRSQAQAAAACPFPSPRFGEAPGVLHGRYFEPRQACCRRRMLIVFFYLIRATLKGILGR